MGRGAVKLFHAGQRGKVASHWPAKTKDLVDSGPALTMNN